MPARLNRMPAAIAGLRDRVAPAPKIADAYYQTPEHRAWRLAVMHNAGWKCQHPGCTVHHPARLFADHIIEIKDGGDPLDPRNGQALCGAHHTGKTAAAKRKRNGL